MIDRLTYVVANAIENAAKTCDCLFAEDVPWNKELFRLELMVTLKERLSPGMIENLTIVIDNLNKTQ